MLHDDSFLALPEFAETTEEVKEAVGGPRESKLLRRRTAAGLAGLNPAFGNIGMRSGARTGMALGALGGILSRDVDPETGKKKGLLESAIGGAAAGGMAGGIAGLAGRKAVEMKTKPHAAAAKTVVGDAKKTKGGMDRLNAALESAPKGDQKAHSAADLRQATTSRRKSTDTKAPAPTESAPKSQGGAVEQSPTPTLQHSNPKQLPAPTQSEAMPAPTLPARQIPEMGAPHLAPVAQQSQGSSVRSNRIPAGIQNRRIPAGIQERKETSYSGIIPFADLDLVMGAAKVASKHEATDSHNEDEMHLGLPPAARDDAEAKEAFALPGLMV